MRNSYKLETTLEIIKIKQCHSIQNSNPINPHSNKNQKIYSNKGKKNKLKF